MLLKSLRVHRNALGEILDGGRSKLFPSSCDSYYAIGLYPLLLGIPLNSCLLAFSTFTVSILKSLPQKTFSGCLYLKG